MSMLPRWNSKKDHNSAFTLQGRNDRNVERMEKQQREERAWEVYRRKWMIVG